MAAPSRSLAPGENPSHGALSASSHARLLPSWLAGQGPSQARTSGASGYRPGPEHTAGPLLGRTKRSAYRRDTRGDPDGRLHSSLDGMASADGAPRCGACGLRPARRHHAAGWYAHCARCWGWRREAQPRWLAKGVPTPCQWCGVVAPRAGMRWCSAACQNAYTRDLRRRTKAEVLAALGGRCRCAGVECWHVGPCPVTHEAALSIDHTARNGSEVRLRRRDGGRSRQGRGSNIWSRYRRALRVADHGMRVLCMNCHWVDEQRARSR